jgi:anti-sigma-K factor RskA/putative zinc finger protein
MTQDTDDSFMENIPAYVLGALGREETSRLKIHLQTCLACQAELARYQQISDGLLTALPPRIPPHRVRRNLLAYLNEKKSPVRPRTIWSFGQIATGLVALFLLGTNLLAFLQIRDLRQQHMQLADQIEKHHTILGMLAASTEIHPVSGDGFSGNLLLDREKNLAYLLTWNLPPPPEGKVYQIWLIDPQGEEIGAGLFRPEGDRPFTSAALATSRTFVEFVGIKVTIEPPGGSEAPTGEQIFNVVY